MSIALKKAVFALGFKKPSVITRNKEQRDLLKARLADLAYIYCESKPDNHDIAMQKEWLSAINKLRRNDSITITKPDKGSGVVILHKSNYTNKMNNILHDETKFERFGPASTCDNTAAIESRLQKRFLELFKAKLISKKFTDLYVQQALKDPGCMDCL